MVCGSAGVFFFFYPKKKKKLLNWVESYFTKPPPATTKQYIQKYTTEKCFSLGYKLAEDTRWELRLRAEVQQVASKGYFVLCISGLPPAAPAPRSSQHCWRCRG